MPAPPGSISSFVFVSNSGTGTISAFAMSPSGSLSSIPGAPFPAGAGAEFMAYDSAHKFLFVSNQSANSLSVFAVNSGTGVLTPVPGSPFATGTRPTGVAVDPMGKFVFVGNQNDSSVSVFNINAVSGTLSSVPGSPFVGIASPFGLAVSPGGNLLFVNDFTDGNGTGANAVSSFQIGPEGALTAVGPMVATTNPPGIAAPIGLVTDGRFLFVADHMAEAVVGFQISAGTGLLTALSPLPAPASSCATSCHHNPLRLTIDAMDRFIYWTNVQAGTVSSFRINNGSLSAVSEVATGQHPFGLALDPSGRFLFVANKLDNSLSTYAVNSSTGSITPLGGSALTGGGLGGPTDLVVTAKQ